VTTAWFAGRLRLDSQHHPRLDLDYAPILKLYTRGSPGISDNLSARLHNCRLRQQFIAISLIY
jgi:hypothetical protein